MVKVPPWQYPSSAPVPPHAADRLAVPGSSVLLGRGHAPWTPNHCPVCSRQPPLKPPSSLRLAIQALIKQHVPTYEAEHVARPATSFFSPRAPEEQILHRGFR